MLAAVYLHHGRVSFDDFAVYIFKNVFYFVFAVRQRTIFNRSEQCSHFFHFVVFAAVVRTAERLNTLVRL